MKIILILWNLIFLAISSYSCFQGFFDSINRFDEKSLNSTKSTVFHLVLNVGIFGYYIQAFVINILLIIRGNKILSLLKSQSLEFTDNKSEKKIGIFTALTQLSLSFSVQLSFDILFCATTDRFDYKNFLIDLIRYFFIFNSQITIVSLILYQSHIVSKQLENILDNFSEINLQKIYGFILETKKFIIDIDHLTSQFILILLVLNLSITVSYLCLFAIDPKNYYIYSIGSIFDSLSILITICLSCSIIPNSLKKFCDKLEELSYKSTIDSSILNQLYQHSLLSKIIAIKFEIGFTANNLFKITNNTIISCLALILSYSVLLIQTSFDN